MRMPQWRQRLLNRRLAHRSPQKVLAGKTRRKHNRGYSRWTTGDFASSTAEMPLPLGIGNASAWECPSPHDGSFRTECSPLLYRRPLRYSLVIVTAYSKNNITSCFVMNIGCASRGPTIHVVCGDLLFLLLLLLCLCVAVCAVPSCVCALSVRAVDTTDRSRRMCMRWSLLCRSCLLLPPPSVCWCCGRAVCVCAPVAVDWSACYPPLSAVAFFRLSCGAQLLCKYRRCQTHKHTHTCTCHFLHNLAVVALAEREGVSSSCVPWTCCGCGFGEVQQLTDVVWH
ncbi:hypothetical protein TCDM_10857 [Trypanosoma cruzi Dm28c]|uniref:Mucin TcMUCII n=1 Tax=Trypanosoma cruzi Dm28c TaxID=1416333 RepID=V5BB05_TRYCR|nr:hypothetical protein TCDM_10857 [Trypanosoma cruzi Dm28c]